MRLRISKPLLVSLLVGVSLVFLLLVKLLPHRYSSEERPYVDPRIVDKVESFEETSLKYTGHTVTVSATIYSVTYLSDHVLGMCIPVANMILINRNYWEHADYLEREQLLFHELGHCELGRWEHEDDLYFRTRSGKICSTSVMTPYVLSERCYFELHDYYMAELFGQRKPYHGARLR